MILGIMSIQDLDPDILPPEIYSYSEVTNLNVMNVYAGFRNTNDVAGTLYYSLNGGSSYYNTSIGANNYYETLVLSLAPYTSGTIDLRAYLVIDGIQTPTVSHSRTFENY